jgi:2',3'-cyclic-nucleotide 2'-phosphodiesterase/3'-nucleotidase
MVFKPRIQKKHLCLLLLSSLLPVFAATSSAKQNEQSDSQEKTIRLKIIGMADLHGNLLPYDHLQRRPAVGGLPYVYSYVKQERKDTTQHVVFLNSGDVLQGSMAAYYYNYIDQRGTYMPPILLGRAGVDASVFGNHDLEPGSGTILEFNRINNEVNSSILGANVVFRETGRRFLRAYTIIERGGLRIAVLGLSTPVLTGCAKTQIVAGLEVRDMLDPARYWMERIRETESPDLVIGLFHAGFTNRVDVDTSSDCFKVNDPVYIAKNVPGFDGIILGHQHNVKIDNVFCHPSGLEKNHSTGKVDNVQVGERSIWLIEPGFGGRYVGVLDLEIQKKIDGGIKILSSSARVENVSETQQLPQEILDEFAEEVAIIAAAANEVVAVLKDTIHTEEAFFGTNFSVSIVHKVQMNFDTAADVSFASPLSSKITLIPGDITFGDLLRIYRFENKLVAFRMTGREIKDYLEYSYSLRINRMLSPDDRFLRLNTDSNSPFLFEIPAFNFDSGAGLDYEVDVTQLTGQRITILRMWKDKPFHEDSTYRIIANSYRFAGAGGHLELGAKISPEELPKRFIALYDTQVRELIRRDFIRQGEVSDFRYKNWKFVPDNFVIPAKERELEVLQEQMK